MKHSPSNPRTGVSIGVKLGFAFALLVSILIGISWLGLHRMGEIDANLNDIFSRHWTKVQMAREMEVHSNENERIAMEIFFGGGTQQGEALLSRRNANSAKIKQLMSDLRAQADSEKERALLQKIEEARAPMRESFRHSMELLPDKPEEARRQMQEETFPLRERYYEARDAFVQYEESQMNDAGYLSQSRYAATRSITMLLIGFAIVMAMVIAAFVTLRLTREVAQREEAEEAIRTLNESLEVKVAERTEELAQAIHELKGEVTERKQIEEALRLSERNFRSLVENSPYGIFRLTPDHRIRQANRALLDMLGYASENEVLGMNTATEVFRSADEHRRLCEKFEKQSEVKGVEVEWKRKDGTPITVCYGRHTVTDQAGNVDHKVVIVEDVTERRALEQQLRQAVKMEAVGRLAGGVAHDFNNLLGVIIGYSELLLEQPEASEAVRMQAEQIQKAGERASSLTRQLLAFSRQQVFETKVLNLNNVIMEMQKMLPRLIGEDVQIRLSLDAKLGHIKADPGQIEQVIMNLAVNSRDAMPDGGTLSLETSNVEVPHELASERWPMAPGRYAMLSVSDTGTGMDSPTIAHMFEPFFTTKGQGRGTGLGLATVYGVIKQSGGYIWAESEPGHGTTFRIYLPRVEQAVQPDRAIDAGKVFPNRAETILLVEDEESLRKLTRTLLERSGYAVLEASDGTEAIAVAQKHAGVIHLLLTDVVMPGMNGRQVAERLTSAFPAMKVVYMSGYSDFRQFELEDSDLHLLQKPFTRQALLRKLNEALELPVNAPEEWEFAT